MRAIKRINHNAAICEDGAGHQLIALGRGIGFGELPREISLENIHRTFYGIDPKYLAFIDEVDPQVLEFAAQFADVVTQEVSYELSSNLPITLADHFQFALKRAREHLQIPMPMAAEVEQTHPVEYKLGEIAVHGLTKSFKVRMPHSEAAGIALSIANSMVKPSKRAAQASKLEQQLLDQAIAIVEKRFDVRVDHDSFSFARFSTHVRYLFKRASGSESQLVTENADIYDMMVEQYPDAVACAKEIGQLIENAYGAPLTRDELVYLTMHINRIATAVTEPEPVR